MKCPKCGYNSFEIHDSCKKCAHDLTGYKDIHGLKSVVLPPETRTIMAEKLRAEQGLDVTAAVVETPADMFSFDIPESDTTPDAASFLKDDPFDFGDEPLSTSLEKDDFPFGREQMPSQAEAGEDAFADLCESSFQNKIGAPSSPQPAAATTPAGLDLNDFNWDDTPDTTPGEAANVSKDDFDSLFGDTDDAAYK